MTSFIKGLAPMMRQMTWGKLYPDNWHEFERMYMSTVAEKDINRLRGRWLAQDAAEPNDLGA